MTVTRSDLERKMGEIQDALTSTAENTARSNVPAMVIAGIVIVILAYVLGRRRGKKRTTVVEIRRV